MKLKDNVTLAEIILSDDMTWGDELNWVPIVSQNTYSVTGALIIQQSTKLAGRPITLSARDSDMGWLPRSTVSLLRTAASIPNRKFTLYLEYPSDTRSFIVMFDHSKTPVAASSAKGLSDHESDDEFKVTLQLIEVPA